MEICKQKEFKTEALPGRGLQKAVGKDGCFKSDCMTLRICTYRDEYGPMEAHKHEEETIVILEAEKAYIQYGDTKECQRGKAALCAGDVLHIPAEEWHVFRYDEGGYAVAACFFAP